MTTIMLISRISPPDLAHVSSNFTKMQKQRNFLHVEGNFVRDCYSKITCQIRMLRRIINPDSIIITSHAHSFRHTLLHNSIPDPK